MDSAELLAQLADIHLPEPVGYWPPAPGWWILAPLIVVGLWLGGRRLVATWRRRRHCRQALLELEGIFDAFALAETDEPGAERPRCVNAFNSVLRRVALTHFPESTVARLGGEDWLRFLRNNGDCMNLDRELAAALSHGRFQPAVSVDVDKLHSFGREWIRSIYLRRGGGRGRPPLRNRPIDGPEAGAADA